MPDGDRHHEIWRKDWFVIIPPIGMLIIYGVACPWLFLAIPFVPIGYFLGQYLSPDLDLVGINQDEGRAMKDFKIIGALFVAWSTVYGYLMRFIGIGRKGHRNFFSHFPIVSTALRMLWFFGVPLFLIWWFLPVPTLVANFVVGIPTLGVFLGLSPSDFLHWFADLTEGGK